jgi:ABC-type dipeptide/oligopeptide/nickel transport system permease component
MGRYVARRLLQTIPVLIGASVLVFLLIHFLPGDPALALLGDNATQEMIDAMRQKLGLNEPLYVQYGIWVGRLLQGDLGTSVRAGQPVADMIGMKIVATAQLVTAAFLLSVLISFPLGILGAIKPHSWLDRFSMAYSSINVALPNYFLGIVLVLIFSVRLNWFPSSGYTSIREDPGAFLRFLALPAITMASSLSAVQMRFVRSALMEVLSEDYVRTARAKGLREQGVVWNHALKNAFISVITILGLQFGSLLTGSVLVETLFGWPGMGRLLVTAISQRDYAMVQANILFLLIIFTLANLVVDISYGWLDPRVSHS